MKEESFGSQSKRWKMQQLIILSSKNDSTHFIISAVGDLGLVSSGFSGAKNDLIAELKLSHTAGGISKLRQEQQRFREEQEKENYRRFLAKFTMENFLEKVRYLRPVCDQMMELKVAKCFPILPKK